MKEEGRQQRKVGRKEGGKTRGNIIRKGRHKEGRVEGPWIKVGKKGRERDNIKKGGHREGRFGVKGDNEERKERGRKEGRRGKDIMKGGHREGRREGKKGINKKKIEGGR